jgi:hypothetical protein
MFEKLGLSPDDFGKQIDSKEELIHEVTQSFRTLRKVLVHLISRDLRVYFDNSKLQFNDSISGYFPYRKRKELWFKFRTSINYKTPPLNRTNFSIALQIITLALSGYYIVKIISGNFPMYIHAKLSGFPFWVVGALLCGIVMIPLLIIDSFGQTALPAKDLDGLINKIIQENMADLLYDDRKKLIELLTKELE